MVCRGLPTSYSLSSFTAHEGIQLYIQGLSCCCVNCFLIISGWYGIKLKFRSIWKLWLILISVYIPCYFANCILNHNFPIRLFLDNLVAFSRESYYIQNYLILLFISPVLNSFIEKFGKRITPFVLALWGIEFIMEYMCGNKCLYIEHGYSLFHFVTMYFLARAAFFNKESLFKVRGGIYLASYFVVALVIACGRGVLASKGSFMTGYSNPLNMIESFCLFFFFVQLSFSNKTINYIASATLTVYVLQVTTPVIEYLKCIDLYLLNNYVYAMYLFMAMGVIVLFFILSVLYAKIMEKVVNLLFSPVGKFIEDKTNKFFIYE